MQVIEFDVDPLQPDEQVLCTASSKYWVDLNCSVGHLSIHAIERTPYGFQYTLKNKTGELAGGRVVLRVLEVPDI